MKIIHLFTHYYLEKDIDKNYGAIEYFEEMEMKILSDYLYYYISSNEDIKSMIRSLLLTRLTRYSFNAHLLICHSFLSFIIYHIYS